MTASMASLKETGSLLSETEVLISRWMGGLILTFLCWQGNNSKICGKRGRATQNVAGTGVGEFKFPGMQEMAFKLIPLSVEGIPGDRMA